MLTNLMEMSTYVNCTRGATKPTLAYSQRKSRGPLEPSHRIGYPILAKASICRDLWWDSYMEDLITCDDTTFFKYSDAVELLVFAKTDGLVRETIKTSAPSFSRVDHPDLIRQIPCASYSLPPFVRAQSLPLVAELVDSFIATGSSHLALKDFADKLFYVYSDEDREMVLERNGLKRLVYTHEKYQFWIAIKTFITGFTVDAPTMKKVREWVDFFNGLSGMPKGDVQGFVSLRLRILNAILGSDYPLVSILPSCRATSVKSLRLSIKNRLSFWESGFNSDLGCQVFHTKYGPAKYLTSFGPPDDGGRRAQELGRYIRCLRGYELGGAGMTMSDGGPSWAERQSDIVGRTVGNAFIEGAAAAAVTVESQIAVGNVAARAGNSFTASVTSHLEAWGKMILDKIRDVFGTVGSTLASLFQSIVSTLADWLAPLVRHVLDPLRNVFSSVVDSLKNIGVCPTTVNGYLTLGGAVAIGALYLVLNATDNWALKGIASMCTCTFFGITTKISELFSMFTNSQAGVTVEAASTSFRSMFEAPKNLVSSCLRMFLSGLGHFSWFSKFVSACSDIIAPGLTVVIKTASGLKGISYIVDFVHKSCSAIVIKLKQFMGSDLTIAEALDGSIANNRIVNFCTFVEAISSDAGRKTLSHSATLQDNIVEIYPFVMGLYSKCLALSSDKANAPNVNLTMQAIGKYKVLLNEVYKIQSFGRFRQEPVGITLSGKAGVGKSQLAKQILDGVSRELFGKPCGDNLYSRSHTKHWDGYKGQPIVLRDDANVVNDPEILAEVISIYNTIPVIVPMAKVDEKGQYFQSTIIMETTNNAFPYHQDIVCLDAIYRRRDFLIHVVTDPNSNTPVLHQATSVSDPNNFRRVPVTVPSLVKAIVSRYRQKVAWHEAAMAESPTKEDKWVNMFNKIGQDLSKISMPTWVDAPRPLKFNIADKISILGNVTEAERLKALKEAQAGEVTAGIDTTFNTSVIGEDDLEGPSSPVESQEDAAAATMFQPEVAESDEVGWFMHPKDQVSTALNTKLIPILCPDPDILSSTGEIEIDGVKHVYDCVKNIITNQGSGEQYKVFYSRSGRRPIVDRNGAGDLEWMVCDYGRRLEHVRARGLLKDLRTVPPSRHIVFNDPKEYALFMAFCFWELRGPGVFPTSCPPPGLVGVPRYGTHPMPEVGTELVGEERARYNVLVRMYNPTVKDYLDRSDSYFTSALTWDIQPAPAPERERPLYEEEVESQSSRISESSSTSSDVSTTCHICDNDLGDQTIIVTCGHRFHPACIKLQYVSNTTGCTLCPVCDASIAPVEIDSPGAKRIRQRVIEERIRLVSNGTPRDCVRRYWHDLLTKEIVDHYYPGTRGATPPVARQILKHVAFDKDTWSVDLIGTQEELLHLASLPYFDRELISLMTTMAHTYGGKNVLETYLACCLKTSKSAFHMLRFQMYLRDKRESLHKWARDLFGRVPGAISRFRQIVARLFSMMLLGLAVCSSVSQLRSLLGPKETRSDRDYEALREENHALRRALASRDELGGFTSRQFFRRYKRPNEPTPLNKDAGFTSFPGIDDPQNESKDLTNLFPTYLKPINNMRLMRFEDGAWFNCLFLGGKWALCNVHALQDKMAEGKPFAVECTARKSKFSKWISISPDDIYVIPNADACVFWSADISSAKNVINRFVSYKEKRPTQLSYFGLLLNSDGDVDHVTGTLPNVVVKFAHDPSIGEKIPSDLLKDRRILVADGMLGYGLSGGLFFDDKLDSGIYGIQSTFQGRRKVLNTAALVFREDLEAIIENVNWKSKLGKNWNFVWTGDLKSELNLDVDPSTVPVSDLFTTDVNLIGKVPDDRVVGVNTKTKIRKTPIAHFFSSKRVPAELDGKAAGVPIGSHPAQKSINKTGLGQQKPLPADNLQLATDMISSHLSWQIESSGGIPAHSYQLTDAIRDEEGRYPPLKLNSSAGLPYVLEKKLKGKKDHISIDDDDGTVIVSEELMENVRSGIDNLANMRLPLDVSYECLKDELRPVEKKYDARTITVMPMHCNLIYRMFFMPFDYAMCRLGDGSNPVCVGINPVSDWTTLYFSLKEVGEYGMEVDVSKWDGKMTPQLARAYVEIVNDVYNSCVPMEEWMTIDDAIQENEVAGRIRRGIVECMMFGIVQFANIAFQKTQGMSSGWGGTAMCNSIVHWVMILTFMLEICDDLKLPGWKSMMTFLDHFCVRVYGDDMVMSISDRAIKLGFTPAAFASKYTKYGWTVTSAAKDRSAGALVKVDEMQFLKRVFRVDELNKAWIHPCLSKDTIEDLAYWQKNDNDPEGSLKENLVTALEFAVEWGPEYFNDFLTRVNHALIRTGRPPIATNYAAMRSIIWGRRELDGVC